MAQVVKKKIVVCGGNGFLGSRICRAAVGRGWDVTSVSRSGEPKWASVTSSPNAPSWSTSVKWHSANILKPTEYNSTLQGADAVVHSMGILLEADYKGVVSGQQSLWTNIQKSFGATKIGQDTNPLERGQGTPIEPKDDAGPITYEVMNRDSAILLARESASKSVPTFVYISADSAPPVLPSRYITSKRAAESSIAKAFPNMRNLFFRPGFLYDASRGFTIPIAYATSLAASINQGIFGGRLTPLMGSGGVKPLKADEVADAVIEAIETAEITGIVDVKQIDLLAQKAWRKGML